MVHILFVIIDGLGDHVIKELGGKTPLESAKTPNLDKLSKLGENGLLYSVKQGIRPGSDTAHLSLFGYDPLKYYLGRGVYEALGAGIDLKESDVAFRVNFATVQNNIILDRRAGRNDYGLDILSKLIDNIEIEGVKIILKHTVEHRGVLVLRGKNLGVNVICNDPHKEGSSIKKFVGLDENSKTTATILNKLVEEFYKLSKDHNINKERVKKGILPANYLLIRGPGKYKSCIPKFYEKYNIKGAFIAGAALYKGVAKYVGLDVIEVPGATGTVGTSLFSKAEAAISCKDKYDIIFVHIKATDSLSHDKNPRGKKKFLERIDKYFINRIKDEFDIICITGDHSTSSIFGEHTADPVPILIYSKLGQRKDSVKNFTERKCYRGILGFIEGLNIMNILLDKADMLNKFGA